MGTWVVDPHEGWSTRCSPELLAICGITQRQIEQNPDALFDCIHPADRAYALTALHQAMLDRTKADLVYRIIRSCGEVRWVRVHAAPIDGSLTDHHRTVGVLFDITERIATKASLNYAEQRYKAAAEASRDALVFLRGVRDPENQITDFEVCDVNLRACELFDNRPGTLVGTTICKAFPRLRTTALFTEFANVIYNQSPHEVTVRNESLPIPAEWLQLQAVPVGEGLALSIRDISAERRLEQQLARAQRLESIGRMATGVAHDFNNMLSAIVGFTTIARDQLDPSSPPRDDLTQALQAANRASQLTRYLLTFASRQPLTPERVCVNDVVSNLSRILARILGNGIRLSLSLDPKVLNVWVDESQLEQAIVNLATNARDAMPKGGTLSIATSATDALVCITVSDTGVGMDPQTRDRIFEPFFTTKGPTKGTGLGLATLYGFVKQSGGRIEVESAPGKGTQFRIHLPHCSEGTERDNVESRRISGPVSFGRECILLVDSDESVRHVARRILELHGYVVVEAENAGEAYFELEATGRSIDLLLLSPHLPRVDAVEFALRAKQNHPPLCVLAMSGAVDQDVLERFLSLTQAQFIAKPLTPERLIHSVQEALQQRATATHRQLAQTVCDVGV